MTAGGVRGGKKFKRKMADLRTRAAALDGTVAEIGFHEPHVAAIARLHEYGSKGEGGAPLPERPAFRAALPAMGKAMTGAIAAEGGKGKGAPSKAVIEAGARGAKAALVRSYEHAPGPPVGEQQEARKAGTPGAGRLLIGAEGPALIGHISAKVDGGDVE
ncbi:MAG: hypothetical protein OXC10_14570 [Rhodospirillaceae bacterium]|nr:hypothetical protein [Rhodospirillaceae bacterium]